MLTKMPKVGDVIIANENVKSKMSSITVGNEYTIKYIDDDGDARFDDDLGRNDYLTERNYECFTLKSEESTAEPVGSIEEIEFVTKELRHDDFEATWHNISLTVDDAGLASVRNLARQSGTEKLRNSIQSQIDALQKELDAL